MIQKYGIIGTLRLVISLLYTKLCFPNARIIRLPFDIRNKSLIKIGKGFTTGFGCRLEAIPSNHISKKIYLEIGENVQINDHVHIAAGEKVSIGNNVLLASKIFISDINHGTYKGTKHDSHPDSIPSGRELSTNPVFIKDNVWVGESVIILPGVTVGKGVVIGANSVVTKDIPDYVIAIGTPATPIKRFNFEKCEWEKI